MQVTQHAHPPNIPGVPHSSAIARTDMSFLVISVLQGRWLIRPANVPFCVVAAHCKSVATDDY